MANNKIYSVKDELVGFTSTFTARNNLIALRQFADTCKDKETILNQHPEQFTLYCLGELDEDTGTITPEVKRLESAKQFVQVIK